MRIISDLAACNFLENALLEGDYAQVMTLIKEKANVEVAPVNLFAPNVSLVLNLKKPFAVFALRWMSENDHPEAIKLLLAQVPSAFLKSEYPIRTACLKGHLDVFNTLLRHPVPLHYTQNNLLSIINNYPAIKNALTKKHENYNPAFQKEFFERLTKDFIYKMSMVFALLHAYGVPHELFFIIGFPINPLSLHYIEEKKDYDATHLINQSKRLMPLFESKAKRRPAKKAKPLENDLSGKKEQPLRIIKMNLSA